MMLRGDVVPKTAENFRASLSRMLRLQVVDRFFKADHDYVLSLESQEVDGCTGNRILDVCICQRIQLRRIRVLSMGLNVGD